MHVACIHPLPSRSLTHSHFFAECFFHMTQNSARNHTKLFWLVFCFSLCAQATANFFTFDLIDVDSSARFEGSLNVDLNEITMNLVPFPRLHYLVSSQTPLYALADVNLPPRRSLVVDAILCISIQCNTIQYSTILYT